MANKSFYSFCFGVSTPLPLEVPLIVLEIVYINVFLFVVVQMFSFFLPMRLLLRTGCFLQVPNYIYTYSTKESTACCRDLGQSAFALPDAHCERSELCCIVLLQFEHVSFAFVFFTEVLFVCF